MNCRPGDIAFVVRARDKRIIGRIVEVIAWIECDISGKSGWAVDFISPVEGLPDNWHMYACPDDRLRPINGLAVLKVATDRVKA